MSPTHRYRRSLHYLIGAAFILAFLGQGLFFISSKSQTADEAVHLGAGYSYLATGDFRLNSEHPPLIKVLCALPVYLWYRLPFEPEVDQWSNAAQGLIGIDFLYDSPVHADMILSLARLPNLLLGACLVAVIGLWSFRIWGSAACLLSMGLAAFDPNLVAHSSLVTTDLGGAVFMCLTLYTLWEYSQRATWGRLAAFGLALGCAFAAKYSSVFLLAILAAVIGGLLLTGKGISLPGYDRHRIRATTVPSVAQLAHSMAFIATAAVISAFVVWATYAFGDITVWWHGVQDVLAHQEQGHEAYLLGQYSRTGWPYYFLVAFLIKTPVGSLVAIFASWLFLWKGSEWSGREALFLILPVYLIFAATAEAQINIGLRHILQAYPLLFVAAGRITTFRTRCVWQVPVACVALVVATMGSSLWAAPHYLAYFNESVGGSLNGQYYLSDSNIDWGQDLMALKKYIEREGVSMIYLSYFGDAPPERRGIHYQYLPAFGPRIPPPDDLIPADADRQLLAISLFNLYGVAFEDKSIYRWLRQRHPTATIGYSIHVYDITNDATAHLQLAEVYRKRGLRNYVVPELRKAIAIDPVNKAALTRLVDARE
jgi:4-amino-4-deoxy-L-arabinose transferase-like glycosyltransferase